MESILSVDGAREGDLQRNLYVCVSDTAKLMVSVMNNNGLRLVFADFLDQLASGKAGQCDWARLVIAHYHDEYLEEIRKKLVKRAIDLGSFDYSHWSVEDCIQFRKWSEQLRGLHKA
jgi:hypothetical protein